MKPLKITIENIKSFKEAVTINFAPLIERGLFGIFGKTGSGKSTILHCINLALYYSGNNFGKNDFINSKSLTAFVGLEFVVKDQDKESIYLVERNFKQNDTESHLYLLQGQTKTCVAEKTKEVTQKVTELIGLSLDEFKKCIALPQGEFAQFINSTSADKTQIISNLFDLHSYGEKLTAKVKEINDELSFSFRLLTDKESEYAQDTKENLEIKKQRLVELDSTKKELKQQIESLNKTIENATRIYENNKEHIACTKKLQELNAQKTQIEKATLQIEIIRKHLHVGVDILRLKDIDLQLKELNINEQAAIAHEKELQTKLENLQYQKSMQNLSEELGVLETKNKELTELIEPNSKLHIIFEQISKLRLDYQAVVKDKLALEKNIDELNIQQSLASNTLSSFESYNFDAMQQVFLQEEHTKNLNYYLQKSKELNSYNDGSKLYVAVKNQVDLRSNYFLSKIDKNSQVCDIAKLADALKQKEEAATIVESLKSKIQQHFEKINEQGAKADEIKEQGAALRYQADKLEESINKFTFGVDLKECIKQTTQKLEKVKQGIEAQEKLILNTQNLLTQRAQDRQLIQNNISSLGGEKQRLKNKLISFGIDLDQNITYSQEELTSIENYVNNYNLQYSLNLEKINKLSSLIDYSIDDNYLVSLKENITKLQNDNVAALENFALEQSIIEKLNERIEKRAQIIKELEQVKNKLTTAQALFDLVKRKKFAEFVAEEYLCELAISASWLLLELTSNRYSLRYERAKDKNDFYVSDNFDEGKLRKVSTLSGGETFLVSLSLAVALSETIYKKSLRPMEFFFLDEGFGTLDKELVEIVISSLEKLKNTHFSIGLISHVGELQERIYSKINVIGATADCGSKIEIIY